jgi:aminoglycoside 3-N-acetyltransferase I
MIDGIGITTLKPGQAAVLVELLSVFAETFDDPRSYASAPPSAAYLERLLAKETFVTVVASRAGRVVGGLVAYVLEKFEQERSEIYIYDLAVLKSHRRCGIATALIRQLQEVAAERGAYVIYVQADPEDAPAIALYNKLGVIENVYHFDIPVPPRQLR